MMSAAHVTGGGIGGLSAAAFLVDDARMPANGITAHESLGVVGGGCDGAGDHANGHRPSDAEAVESLRIASSLSYRLASPTKGESRSPHAQYTARAQVAMLAPRETGRALREPCQGKSTLLRTPAKRRLQ